MIVQIYEVSSPEEGLALAQRGVDHVGVLVGDGTFPRELSTAAAKAIFSALPQGTIRVALSLSSSVAQIAHVTEKTEPDILHIGAAIELVSPEQVSQLKRSLPHVAWMRAVPVVGHEAVEWAKAYEGIADWLLLDSHKHGDVQIGALGITHDWTISRRIVESTTTPVILAGGLGPDNVSEAIKAVRPAGVDSKTKTDRGDGNGKDLTKVERFVTSAKAVPI